MVLPEPKHHSMMRFDRPNPKHGRDPFSDLLNRVILRCLAPKVRLSKSGKIWQKTKGYPLFFWPKLRDFLILPKIHSGSVFVFLIGCIKPTSNFWSDGLSKKCQIHSRSVFYPLFPYKIHSGSVFAFLIGCIEPNTLPECILPKIHSGSVFVFLIG